MSVIVGLFNERYTVSKITYVENVNSVCVDIISIKPLASMERETLRFWENSHFKGGIVCKGRKQEECKRVQ